MAAAMRPALAVRVMLLAGLSLGASARAGRAAESPRDQVMPEAARSLIDSGARAGDRVVMVGMRGNIIVSDDNGGSWRQVKSPVGDLLSNVVFTDAKTGYAVGYDAVILKTEDAGDSWAVQHSETEGDAELFGVAFATPQHGVAVGGYALRFDTDDGGATWRPAKLAGLDDDFHFNAVLALGPEQFMIAGESGNVWVSDNGAADWTSRKLSYAGSMFGALRLRAAGGAAGDIVVHGLRGKAFRTADLGKSWAPLETGTKSGLLGATQLKDGRLAFVGNDGLLLVSDAAQSAFTNVPHAGRASFSAAVETADGRLIIGGEEGVVTVDLPPAVTAAAE